MRQTVSDTVAHAKHQLDSFQKRWFVLYLALMILTTLGLASCQKTGEKPPSQARIKIVTTLFPLYDFAAAIGKDRVHVTLLLPPGVEAHAFEPKPADIARIHDSDLFIFTGNAMEPWVAKILQSVQSPKLVIIDASKGITLAKSHPAAEDAEHDDHEHGNADPHIWLDFDNAGKMIDAITAGLIGKDQAGKDVYLKNAQDYRDKLAALDRNYEKQLTACHNKFIVYAGHASVGYLMNRYHIEYITAYKGFSPNTEPTPKALAEMVNIVKKRGLRYIYYEELISPRVADVISAETGAKLLMLNGAHNLTKKEFDSGVSYLGLMEKNLENLAKGMECPRTSSP